MHESPSDVICFVECENDEDPVEDFHAYKKVFDQKSGFDDAKSDFYDGNNR